MRFRKMDRTATPALRILEARYCSTFRQPGRAFLRHPQVDLRQPPSTQGHGGGVTSAPGRLWSIDPFDSQSDEERLEVAHPRIVHERAEEPKEEEGNRKGRRQPPSGP